MNTHSSPIARVAAAAALLATLGAFAPLGVGVPAARGGGFELPEGGARALSRGGAFAVGVDDPSALFLNPGAMIRLRGTHLLLNHVLVWENAAFTRQASDLPPGTSYPGFDPLAEVENSEALFPLGGMLLVTSDLGLDDFTFGAGIYGPNAHGKKQWPTSGGQRYMLTSLDAVLFYPSIAVAYGDRETFGVGLTLQWVMAPSLKLGLVVDGSQAGELHAYYSGNDVEAEISLSDMTSFSAILGAWWRPTPELEVGVSGRVVPAALNLDGEFTLNNIPGQTQFSDAQLEVTGSAARLDLTLPPTARAGVRYRALDGGREVLDIELNVVYEAWSMIERYDVQLDGIINLFVGAEAPNAVIEKRWMDTLSVRLGGSWKAWEAGGDGLQLSLGAYYESPTVPDNYEHLDFMAFDRVGIGAGVTATIGPIRATLAYSHVFQGSRDVDERYGKVYQQRPLDPCPDQCDGGAGWDGVPSNAGHYASSYDLLAAAIEASF